ncbi:putative transcriptional regulatory [Hyphodiscus hymeniophilus]|uniref:Transcriptional regulatory n=1 Tax=Hyphodiscus hymeniophilus TaxID=353542 RepID=A0A9P6VR32_9HELO|nr:putative transcriptional regulatory [Hyphodiscus hymeniophilus]
MVTRGTYFDEDDYSARRYSNRGHGYPLNHERDQPLPPTQHTPYSRQNSPEQDMNSAPRRRIPVACGRCRKRKIRCSGDPGNGQPCVNCKTAGNDACQFLRVSSTEAQMKNDGTDFSYDSAPTAAVSRVNCRMSVYGPQHQPYTPQVTPLGQDTYPPYRHSSLSTYQPVKYYAISSYNDFADENVDYGIPTSNYSVLNQDPINIPYNNVGSARWAQHQLPKSNSLFVEQDAPYNHLPSYPNAFPYRPNLNTESKSLSLHSMANALSPSVSGADRVLPAPAPVHYRTAQVAGPYLRSTDNSLSLSQGPVYNNNNGLMGTHMINAVKALSASSSSESMTSSSYLPYRVVPQIPFRPRTWAMAPPPPKTTIVILEVMKLHRCSPITTIPRTTSTTGSANLQALIRTDILPSPAKMKTHRRQRATEVGLW